MIRKGDKVVVKYFSKGECYSQVKGIADSDQHQIPTLSYGPHLWVKFPNDSRYELAINGSFTKISKEE